MSNSEADAKMKHKPMVAVRVISVGNGEFCGLSRCESCLSHASFMETMGIDRRGDK